MDVQLYVYDLSKGLARQFSQQLLGRHIDAVYHTALVLGGVEYFFGAGIQTCYPGTTHHGAPMEIVPLGRTELPIEIVLEYLESLKEIYTAESYDLFMHNCNNFSHDFAMFLVGKGIPTHITSLPQTVLDTPFGQMLRPQLDRSMRSITQAPVVAPPQLQARSTNAASVAKRPATKSVDGQVHNVSTNHQLDQLLSSCANRCAVIFFTSNTCAPCKLVYPTYDDLAAETAGQATLIKVDINNAYEIAAKYSIRATPSFMTFLRGQKDGEWSGADSRELKSRVQMLVQAAFPPHPHAKLNLPHLLRTSLRAVTYSKMPPLDKLTAKMGAAGNDPSVISMKRFLNAREVSGAIEAPLPDLSAYSAFLEHAILELPLDILFTVYDLFRLALVDPRVSGFFVEEHNSGVLRKLIAHVNSAAKGTVPYNLRIVTLHMCCNLFTSPITRKHIVSSDDFLTQLTTLISTSLLDDAHANVRVAASSLAFNLTAANHRIRMEEKREALPADDQVELAASLLEALGVESESKEAVKGLVLAIGFLVYHAPADGEILDLCRAMDAEGTVVSKESLSGNDSIVKEVGRKLLAATS